MAASLTVRVALLVLLLVSGCTAQPEAGPPASAPADYNATDVMFLQMALAQIDEGMQVVEVATGRAAGQELRGLVTELRTQWDEEAGRMRGWLEGWQVPLTADPSAGVHAGHGEVHMLRPSDIEELRTATDFDRTVVSLLLGHLGNCVETARMETAGGMHPPAKELAATVTERRQAQVRELLTLAAQG